MLLTSYSSSQSRAGGCFFGFFGRAGLLALDTGTLGAALQVLGVCGSFVTFTWVWCPGIDKKGQPPCAGGVGSSLFGAFGMHATPLKTQTAGQLVCSGKKGRLACFCVRSVQRLNVGWICEVHGTAKCTRKHGGTKRKGQVSRPGYLRQMPPNPGCHAVTITFIRSIQSPGPSYHLPPCTALSLNCFIYSKTSALALNQFRPDTTA